MKLLAIFEPLYLGVLHSIRASSFMVNPQEQ